MTTESLFVDIYPEVLKSPKDYCSICFRTSNERRLLNGINLTKFKLFRQYNHLEINGNINKFCNQKICYMCDAQAAAANRFCFAVNLSHHIHNLFNTMAKQPNFALQVMDHLKNVGNPQPELLHNHHSVESLQTMLEQLRRNTMLLQTETLLLNNPGEDCIVETCTAPARAPADGGGPEETRDSLRDLLAFESQPGGLDDDALFDLDSSDIDNKQIIIEDDDLIKEEPPDQNVFIIPDTLPSDAPHSQTDNTTGYVLHPILFNNGTITIPSLDKNISINNPNLIANGLDKNTSSVTPLDRFIVTPLPPKSKIVGTSQNTPNIHIIQNTNSLAKNIVSMVKNSSTGQNTVQDKSNLNQNNRNTSNVRQQILHNMSIAMASLQTVPPCKPSKTVVTKKLTPVKLPANTPVKLTATPVRLSRGDSDSNASCQSIKPIRKPDGKIDWEDKIPMDVISFVSASDPTTAKRQRVTSGSGPGPGPDPDNPMGNCVIMDVKSVRDTEVIDLC